MRAHRSQFSFPTASALWIRFFFLGTIYFCHENPIQITGHLRLRSFCVFPPPPSICRCHTAASITSKVGDFDQTSSSSECALLLASNSSQFGANIWSNVANLNVKTALKPTWWPPTSDSRPQKTFRRATTIRPKGFWKVEIEYPNKSNHKNRGSKRSFAVLKNKYQIQIEKMKNNM